MTDERPAHLAWHETLELHEMVAMQSTALMKCKLFVGEVKDSTLMHLYNQSIADLEHNLKELLRFYPKAARHEEAKMMRMEMDDSFYAAELLSFSKVLVKGLAAAITETATNSLRETFIGQLKKAIQCHSNVFHYMLRNGYYPAYDLPK
ncbi:MAG TPA: spore coat protein, partial [Sporolactobacillaceae bacterium]|nr:spore coat protein [Sporolactobacillaceae bacterium]